MTADRSSVLALPRPQGLGEDPLTHFTRVYLLFLQGLFNQFPKGKGCFHWSNSDIDTEIAITDQAPIPRDRIEQRPAIVTMRGPAQFANLSMDQLRTLDMKTGERGHTDLVACTMSINCVAKNGIEAQRLGWIVMRHIRTFKRLLQRNGGMHRVGEQVSVGPESPPGAMVLPEPDPATVMVTVHSPFFFQWNEKVKPTNAPALNGIEAHITANLASPEMTSSGAIRPTEAIRPTSVGSADTEMTGIGAPSDGTLEGSTQVGTSGVNAGLGCVRSKVPTIRGVPLTGTSVPIDGSQPKPTGSIEATVKV